MVRPTIPSATNFLRKLKPPELMVLIAAGEGCKSKGFNECLDVYQQLWNLGYRPGVDLEQWIASTHNQPSK